MTSTWTELTPQTTEACYFRNPKYLLSFCTSLHNTGLLFHFAMPLKPLCLTITNILCDNNRTTTKINAPMCLFIWFGGFMSGIQCRAMQTAALQYIVLC